MADKDIEILFAFLKDIIFQPRIENIDTQKLSQEARRLGEGMNVLNQYIMELKRFSCDIAKGNLETDIPSKENRFCWPLKTLQANLLHLTWQTQQVAKGDYKQHVDFLGEFSMAFNSMVEQLEQREEALRRETERAKEKAMRLEEYNTLITCITDSLDDWIVILDVQTGELLFQNRSASNLEQTSPTMRDYLMEELKRYDKGWHGWEVEYQEKDEKSRRFHIDSFNISFSDRIAKAHKITDITVQKEYELQLERYAYRDQNTDLYNRRFCMMELKKLIHTQIQFSLCYIDLDHLKQVNDQFGHDEGDYYIQTLSKVLQECFRGSDRICRIGGDEFVVIIKDCSAAMAVSRMKSVYDEFERRGKERGLYAMNFSYGIQTVDKRTNLIPEDVLKEADKSMYLFKKKYRKDLK